MDVFWNADDEVDEDDCRGWNSGKFSAEMIEFEMIEFKMTDTNMIDTKKIDIIAWSRIENFKWIIWPKTFNS